MPAPAGVAKLSIAALKRTISRAGLSTDGLIERRELEAEATRALQILEERWRESSDDEESPPQSKPKTKISRKTKSQKPRGSDRGYNELIVGTEHFLSTLPGGVEAFFYLKTPRCQGSGCEQKARAGRATFASDYSLGPGEAPLLSFDPGNWEAPFAVPEE